MDDESRHALVEPMDPAAAEVFRKLTDVVHVDADFSEMYAAIVVAAPRLVEGCDHASLMLRRNGVYETAASSDEVGARIDAMERELGEGPCIDAVREDSVYHDGDLTDGSPWQNLTDRVLAETPVRSMAGFRIRLAGENAGALNLFSDSPGGLTERAVEQGIVLSSFISVALLAAHERRAASTLRSGLESNRMIGQAMGLLMGFHKVGADDAFAMLKRTSQDLNVKLSEVARQVVQHHNQA
jgi:GAF domain-containing protein